MGGKEEGEPVASQRETSQWATLCEFFSGCSHGGKGEKAVRTFWVHAGKPMELLCLLCLWKDFRSLFLLFYPDLADDGYSWQRDLSLCVQLRKNCPFLLLTAWLVSSVSVLPTALSLGKVWLERVCCWRQHCDSSLILSWHCWNFLAFSVPFRRTLYRSYS